MTVVTKVADDLDYNKVQSYWDAKEHNIIIDSNDELDALPDRTRAEADIERALRQSVATKDAIAAAAEFREAKARNAVIENYLKGNTFLFKHGGKWTAEAGEHKNDPRVIAAVAAAAIEAAKRNQAEADRDV
jgi:hypothetical protein